LLRKFLELIDISLDRKLLVAAGAELDMMRFVYVYVTRYRVYME
jgi:hypothetical protein